MKGKKTVIRKKKWKKKKKERKKELHHPFIKIKNPLREPMLPKFFDVPFLSFKFLSLVSAC